MATVGSLQIGINVDLTGLTTGLAKVRSQMDAFSATEGKAGSASADFQKQTDRTESSVKKLGDSTSGASNIITANFSKLGNSFSDVGRKADAGLSGVSNAVTKASRDTTKARDDIVGASTDVSTAGGDITRSTSSVGASLGPVATSLTGSFIPALIGAGIAAGALLAPMAALTIGAAGAATAITLAIAPVAMLGAGIVALASWSNSWIGASANLTTAQSTLTTATSSNTSAQQALRRAQLAVSGTAKPTASQLLTLQQAQDKASTSADALTTAQQGVAKATTAASNPLKTLTDSFSAMGHVLGTQATPVASALLGWVLQFIPAIQNLGSGAITFFSTNMAGFLGILKGLADTSLKAVQDVGSAFAKFYGEMTVGKVDIKGITDMFSQLGTSTIGGLLDNLSKLSEWFSSKMGGTMMTQAGQFFSAVGYDVQALIGWIGGPGGLIDQVSKFESIFATPNGPNTATGNTKAGKGPTPNQMRGSTDTPDTTGQATAAGQQVGLAIGIGITSILTSTYGTSLGDKLGPFVNAMMGAMMSQINWGAIAQVYATNSRNSMLILPSITLEVGQAIGSALLNGITTKVIPGLASLAATLVGWVGQIGAIIGSFFSILGGIFSNSWNAIWGDTVRVWDQIGSSIGQAANGIANTVGGIFNGIGTAFHNAILGAGRTLRDDVDNYLIQPLDNLINGIDNSVLVKNLGMPGIPDIGYIPGFASGGIVPGSGHGDTVHAMLTPGEVILNRLAVDSLGGPNAANTLNQKGAGASGPGPGVGGYGGQCVVFVEQQEGIHFPVEFASQMVSYINSTVPKVGEIFVSTIPPDGHTGIINGPNSVIDSNWGLDEMIQIHSLSGIPDIAGYIDLGKGLPSGLPTGVGGAAGPSIPNIADILSGIMGGIDLSATPSWLGQLPTNLLGEVVSSAKGYIANKIGAVGKMDNGGGLPPGLSTVLNDTGRIENVQSPQERDALIDEMRGVRQAVEVLHKKVLGTVNISGADQRTASEMVSDISFRGYAGTI